MKSGIPFESESIGEIVSEISDAPLLFKSKNPKSIWPLLSKSRVLKPTPDSNKSYKPSLSLSRSSSHIISLNHYQLVLEQYHDDHQY